MTPITAHFNDAIVKLVAPYWGKPRIASLMLAMMNRVQELEDATWEVLEKYTLDGADDARLNVLGRVVGQPNLGWITETYRAVLRGKIRANRSRGLAIDIIEVCRLVTPTAGRVNIAEPGNANLLVWLDDAISAQTLIALTYLLPKTRAAGVGLTFFWSEGGIDEGFIWDESNWDDASDDWFGDVIL